MSRYSKVAAILIAIAVFIFDTLTPLDIAIAVLYVAVVLLSINFANRRGTMLIGLACMGVTVLSFVLTHGADFQSAPVARCVVSLAAIGITTLLALRLASTITVIAESEERYRTIFMSTGVATMEMDFSALKEALDKIRETGTTDLSDLAAQDPGFAKGLLDTVRLIDANATALKMFDAKDIETLRANIASLIPAQLGLSATKLLEAIWSGQYLVEADTALTTLTGRRLEVLYTIAMPAAREKLDLVLVTVMDMTARKQAEHALHEAQTELAHVSRVSTLGELAVSIAHEVNQPLAGVVTNGEAGLRWLRRTEPDLDEVTAALERAIFDARRATDVVKRLRSLSKKAEPVRTEMHASQLVEETIWLVQREIAVNRVVLEVSLAPDMPRVSGDKVQLQQVLINLIMNAIQAMSTIHGDRRLKIVSQMGDGGVSIAVIDSGPGFDAEQHARLFVPFYTTKADGMGMGLPICRSIVEAHGGWLRASTPVNGGAQFEFTLPGHFDC